MRERASYMHHLQNLQCGAVREPGADVTRKVNVHDGRDNLCHEHAGTHTNDCNAHHYGATRQPVLYTCLWRRPHTLINDQPKPPLNKTGCLAKRQRSKAKTKAGHHGVRAAQRWRAHRLFHHRRGETRVALSSATPPSASMRRRCQNRKHVAPDEHHTHTDT